MFSQILHFYINQFKGKAKNVPANTCGTVMNWDNTCCDDLGKNLFICEGISVLCKCISFGQLAMQKLGKRHLSLPLFSSPLHYDNEQNYSKNSQVSSHTPPTLLKIFANIEGTHPNLPFSFHYLETYQRHMLQKLTASFTFLEFPQNFFMLRIIFPTCLLLFKLERQEAYNNIYNKNRAVMTGTFKSSLKM